jgi:hypothetical protein
LPAASPCGSKCNGLIGYRVSAYDGGEVIVCTARESAFPPYGGASEHLLMELKMSVRLKLEDSSEGLVATISQRDEAGKVTGRPATFLVGTKEEAKERAKTLARTLGLKTYGIVDRTVTSDLPVS